MSNQINPQEVKIGDRLEWPNHLERSKPNPTIEAAVVAGETYLQTDGVWIARCERADGTKLAIRLNDPKLQHFPA
jgi:hypothetical protein